MSSNKPSQRVIDAAARSGWILTVNSSGKSSLYRYTPSGNKIAYYFEPDDNVADSIVGICHYLDDQKAIREEYPNSKDNYAYLREMYRELANAVLYAVKEDEMKSAASSAVYRSEDIKSFKERLSKAKLKVKKPAKKPAKKAPAKKPAAKRVKA